MVLKISDINRELKNIEELDIREHNSYYSVDFIFPEPFALPSFLRDYLEGFTILNHRIAVTLTKEAKR